MQNLLQILTLHTAAICLCVLRDFYILHMHVVDVHVDGSMATKVFQVRRVRRSLTPYHHIPKTIYSVVVVVTTRA